MFARFGRVLLGAFLLSLVFASPASAHAGDGAVSSNYLVGIDGMQPPQADISARLIDATDRIELRSSGPREAVVLGARNEPYLRVGPDGAFENKASPTALLNKQRIADSPVGTDAPQPPPDWKKLSDEPVLRWHDQRANFSEDNKPAVVVENQSRRQMLSPGWSIPLTVDGSPVTLTGSVEWVPGPSPVPKYIAAGVIAIAITLLMLTRRWREVLAAALALLVVADLEHSVLIAARKASTWEAFTGWLSGFYAIGGWVMAGGAIYLLFKKDRIRRDDALFYAIFAAIVMGFFSGLLDAVDLSRSQIPTAGPAELSRWSVAAAIGLGCGIFLGSVTRLLKDRPPAEVATTEVNKDQA